MRRNWEAIWLVARREFIDQFRDWRIIVPMTLLVTVFPFIADDTTRQAIGFMNRFGGDLILDNLIPFVILVIGFFPLSFTLVVALEAFVGEKERGTIEPLLSSPLEDRHLYLGKLLVGIVTPLVFSYLSIGIYLFLVSRRDVAFPSPYMLVLILLLTFAHAVLMVSSAIVISVQATTIRSANLMASFVVVPVAFMLQGETILIFWGNEDVLWYAILAVTLLAILLVRLGLAHFKREYLLGREIDMLNFKNMYRVFRDRFTGGAKSLPDWYRWAIPATLRQLRYPLIIVFSLGLIAIFASYAWVMFNIPAYVELSPERLDDFRLLVRDNLVNLDGLDRQIPAPFLFFYNARTTLVFLLMGLVSFGTLGLVLFIANFALVGGVLGAASLVGFSPFLTFAAGILPHGVFELTAVILATAATYRVGVLLVSPDTDRSLGETLLLSLADWFKVFIGVVIPLLAIAAVIEIYLTPILLKMVFPFL
ncbi:MAG: stage II sporulation protein M [Chloroflexi bacterium]|nr:stage II sporulation protein M [Chloroflexota bacterium]